MSETVIYKNNRSILLRRKIAIFYARFTFSFKILLCFGLWLILCTDYLVPIRTKILDLVNLRLSEYGFTFDELYAEGIQNLTLEEIKLCIPHHASNAITAINLSSAHNKLLKNRWIKSASITRMLPNKIRIIIEEREPIAIWQNNRKLFLIDETGFAITDKPIQNFLDLPHVIGEDADIYAGELISDIKRHPELRPYILSASRYGQRRWNLNLKQDITVKMPEKNFDIAYDYLAELNKAHKLFDQNYKTIDLRNSEKYYIEQY